MNKTKLLSIVSIGLLLLNLVLIGFILSHRPIHNKDFRQKIIIEKLQFNTTQAEQYQKLIAKHRDDISISKATMNNLRNALYATINKPIDNIEKDSIIIAIGNTQADLEQIHYNHFTDIKAICTQQQLPAFEALTKELSNIFSPQKPKDEKP